MKRKQEPDQRPLRAAMGPVSLSTWSFLGGAHLKAIWTDTEPDKGDIERLLDDLCGKIAGKYSAMSSRP